MKMIDFFMAGTVVDAAGQFNRRAPRVVKRAGIVEGIGAAQDSIETLKRFWRDPVKRAG